MKTFRTFTSKQAARDYRHENGTGGWIFAPDDSPESILFPPDMTPTDIFNHVLTEGKSGDLLGSQ